MGGFRVNCWRVFWFVFIRGRMPLTNPPGSQPESTPELTPKFMAVFTTSNRQKIHQSLLHKVRADVHGFGLGAQGTSRFRAQSSVSRVLRVQPDGKGSIHIRTHACTLCDQVVRFIMLVYACAYVHMQAQVRFKAGGATDIRMRMLTHTLFNAYSHA